MGRHDGASTGGERDGVPEPAALHESPGADAARYLRRIGIEPDACPETTAPEDLLADGPSPATLGRLQRAHLYAVPFETLSINGSPHEDADGPGLSLDLGHLFEKVVLDGQGGFCFEVNGLFTWLLRALGYDAGRAAGMVLSDDGRPTPANHHVILVEFDGPYVVDVGTGVPNPRRPVPLDGSAVTDERGVDWRVVESDRPDADYRLEYRWESGDAGGDDGWQRRYVFDPEPRDLTYFRATCGYLAEAPESGFVGDPTVLDRTPAGHRKLSPDALTVVEDGEETERAVEPEEWESVLGEAFGLTVPR